MKYLLGIFLLFNFSICYADIYQQQDANQNTVYSDTPLSSDAQVVATPSHSSQITSKQPESVAAPTDTGTTKTVANGPRKEYTVFLIASPVDQQTIQNQPIIPVEIQVNPEIQPGDQIQLFLDNKPVGIPKKSTQLQLEQVERGTHQLYGMLIDEKGNSIRQSNMVTIFVHRSSVATINANKNRPSN